MCLKSQVPVHIRYIFYWAGLGLGQGGLPPATPAIPGAGSLGALEAALVVACTDFKIMYDGLGGQSAS